MRTIVLTLIFAVTVAGTALASGSEPLPTPEGTPHPNPESFYNKGLALADAGDFIGAEAAYRQALALAPQLPEAWNGLGHTLKKQGRFEQSLAAYNKALELRPNYPLAMQYLGELYIEMGQLNNARALLGKLRPIDAENADKLAAAISVGASKW